MSRESFVFDQFPLTDWQIVQSASLADLDSEHAERALNWLCGSYWRPLYGIARNQGLSPHDAEDATQTYFQGFLRKKIYADFDRGRGRMRTFLASTFRKHLVNEYRHQSAKKRGGGIVMVSVDAAGGEEWYGKVPKCTKCPETYMDLALARNFIDMALEDLRKHYAASDNLHTHDVLAPHLDKHKLEDGVNASIQQELSITESTVRSYLSRMRKTYRALLRARVRQSLAAPDEKEVEDELRAVVRILSAA